MATSSSILIRGPEGFSIWHGPPFPEAGESSFSPCTTSRFSEDGSVLMLIKSDSTITFYDCNNNYFEIRTLNLPSLLSASLSPKGSFVQTFQRPSSPQHNNVSLSTLHTASPVYHFFQKNMTNASWPSIRFSYDEDVACRLATNEIHFFDTTDFSKGVVHRLRVPGVAAFELASSPASHVATFTPESKGSPAVVQIFSCVKDMQTQPVARRSFFRCSTVQLKWNRGSTGLLAVAQADVDKTNQSYYGESKLYYLTTDGKHEGLVSLRKEGPIHDVQWSYSGSEFAVVYGFMPASATLFDRKCNPLLELGSGPYNTVRWNPKGKFLCLAGFGNLPGDMAFWDYMDKKQLGTTRAEWSVMSEWSPDGRYFMTATTAPRLQVDNGIKIFHHNGSLYFKKMFDKLYQVEWRPESPDKFAEITELIKSIGSIEVKESKPQGQGAASKKNVPANPPAQKPTAYRPPHAKQAAAVQAELFGGSSTEQMSKNALKNKKKREKAKEKKAAEAAGATTTEGS